MNKRLFSLIAAFGLLTSLAFVTPSQAGTIPFTYTATITSDTLSYMDMGAGSGTVTPTAISGTQSGVANSAPSTLPASDAIGGYTYTYSGGNYPPNAYFVTGSVDVQITVTDTASGQTGIFTVVETYGNLVSSNTVPPSPSLTGSGATVMIGNYSYTLNTTSIGTNINIPGTAILIGFQYTSVPEPNSMAMLGIGMMGFFAFRRFFNKRNADV
jgi:hypothetical protein